MQNLPYKVKVKRAEQRVYEFLDEMDKRGCNAHVSVGGLDSITLLLFIRHLGIDIPAISVSGVEDKSIQKVHESLGELDSSRIGFYDLAAEHKRKHCEIINREGDPGIDGNGKCMGFGRSEEDDEPCQPCKRCKHCTSYEKEAENE